MSCPVVGATGRILRATGRHGTVQLWRLCGADFIHEFSGSPLSAVGVPESDCSLGFYCSSNHLFNIAIPLSSGFH